MPHYSKYKCSVCGAVCDRADLACKRVNFQDLGAGSRVIRSRTVSWLCKDKCLELDPDYLRPAFDTPGMKSGPLERVRAAREKTSGQG